MIQPPEVITEPIDLTPIDDPQPGTEAFKLAENRTQSSLRVDVMPWLPQLPETRLREAYDRIVARERELIAPNRLSEEYRVGTARVPDEIFKAARQAEDDGVLYTAEHATETGGSDTSSGHVDWGTGGLTAVLAEDYGVGLIMRGRQTSNVAKDPNHPIKKQIDIYAPWVLGFISIHGMAPGKFVRPDDTSELQVSLGLGIDPPEEMRDFANRAVKLAHDLGLRAVIGNDQEYYRQKPDSTEIERDQNNNPRTHRLGGLKPNMTVNYARQRQLESGRPPSALQVELTSLLRLTPIDVSRKDKVAEIIGVALGHKLLVGITLMINSSRRTADEIQP